MPLLRRVQLPVGGVGGGWLPHRHVRGLAGDPGTHTLLPAEPGPGLRPGSVPVTWPLSLTLPLFPTAPNRKNKGEF